MKVSRRTSLKLAGVSAVAPLSGLLAGPALARAETKTFVLVHGAWHGGWCWNRVRDLLTLNGHRVFTPTLPGLAEHSHMLSKSITLDTHIDDLANLFKWEDIDKAVLVAHSYGGWVVSGALEKIGRQVASVMFLDAFLPENGQAPRDLNPPAMKQELDAAIARGEIGRPAPKAEFFQIIKPEDVAYVQAKMTPQPINTLTTPIRLTGARDRVPKKFYIRAPSFKMPPFDKFYETSKGDSKWSVTEIDPKESGHDVMIDAPARLTKLLEEAAT